MSGRVYSAAGLIAMALSAAAAPWPEISDQHLSVVPRTAAERERIMGVMAPPTRLDSPEPFEVRSGGAATSFATPGPNAFSNASANISFEQELEFKVGNGLFKKLWVSAPASTKASDGLGPLYNARSCQRCHLKDGRGHPPDGPDDTAVSLLLRISLPAPEGQAASPIPGAYSYRPHPSYGFQIQDFSIAGVPVEGQTTVVWKEIAVALSEGETASLRRPVWRVTGHSAEPLGDAMISPRVAQQMIGLGLLEAIPAEEILALSDPTDADGDGISGRPQIVLSAEHGVPMLGRFGHKAGMPSVREQSASAFSGDMGLSTTVFPSGHGDCLAAQTRCLAALTGGEPEVEDVALDLVTFYARNLAVPARRDVDDPQVLAGKRLFHETGCAACHVPKHVTHRLADRPEQSFQLIWPYTDLLLHDMGEGLADDRPEGRASGREWRTPPLWGIGLTAAVSGHNYFLHDGRARSLLEAVLWHGGEAQAARDAVAAMPKADRAALIRYLESL
ncbi:MAG: di-heme oxidoredictase family protein [Pseudomonadota bacterium]